MRATCGFLARAALALAILAALIVTAAAGSLGIVHLLTLVWA